MTPATPITPPRVSLVNGQVAVNWSNGSPFNGYCLIGLVFPTDGVTQWAEMDYGNIGERFPLPQWARLPIRSGYFNPSCGLFYNSDIVPPESKYIAYYYDRTNRQIAGPSSEFTLSTANFTPPTLTLTAPTGPGTAPIPD